MVVHGGPACGGPATYSVSCVPNAFLLCVRYMYVDKNKFICCATSDASEFFFLALWDDGRLRLRTNSKCIICLHRQPEKCSQLAEETPDPLVLKDREA